ncbi:MAG: BcsR/BcsP family cellulose biosynthesis protein [Alcaligenaceae bacterium]
MKDSNDIANLYKTLGQNPNRYEEIVRDEELAQANERWPLIAAMHDADFSPPPVDQTKRGTRERPPVVVFEHENELEVGAPDYHERVQTVKVIEALADPATTPTWAEATHDVPPAETNPEPAQDLIETGWIAPERTAAQIELAAQIARAAQAAHEEQIVREAQAAKEALAQRDAEAAQQEQAELAAQAARDADTAKDVRRLTQAQAAQAAKDLQRAKEDEVVKLAQFARYNEGAAAQKEARTPKVAAARRAESLMDDAASAYDDLGPVLEDVIEEEIASVVVNPGLEGAVAEPVALPKVVAAQPTPRALEKTVAARPVLRAFEKTVVAQPVLRAVEKNTPAKLAEPVSLVTLKLMRLSAKGEPRPLAALFTRLSTSAPAQFGGAEGKKTLLFERMKRT